MNKKLIILISSISLAFGSLFALNSCGKDNKEKVEVVFRSNGGTTYYNVSGYAGETIELPTPEKEGYKFMGWYDNSKFTGEALDDIYTIDVGRNLYAKWEAYTGTIKFESNGGTSYCDIDFEAQKIELPVPEREGYLFNGWYDNSDFSGNIYEGTILPTDDLTLYASWNMVTGSVTFVSNGGTEYNKIETAGQLVTLPTPEKESYIFAGWYDNEKFEGKPLEGNYLPEGDITLYARWAHTFTLVTLEENGGSLVDDIKLFDNDVFKLPTPEKYGYSFKGWYTNEYLTGDPVSDYFYRPSNDVTLYAKWSKCSYLYLFYNEPMEWVRFEYEPGSTITVDELNSLYTPNDLVVVDSFGFEHNAPFMCWANQGYDVTLDTPVTEDIKLENDFLILVAQYDKSNVPVEVRMTYNKETGVYTSTGKACHEFIESPEKQPYVYSLDVSFRKGIGGAGGPAIRMNVGRVVNHFELGCEYISAVVTPSTGNIALAGVNEGDYSKLGGVDLNALPLKWREKYESAKTNDLISLTISMVDYGSYIEVYMDGELAYTYSNTAKLAEYTYDGLGVRTSSYPADFSNPKVTYESKVSFNTGVEGLTVPDITWMCGDIDLPVLERENLSLAGWYYDKECTKFVDYENCLITEDTTLYAKWVSEFYKISFDENGGSECNNINWAYGKVQLPTPKKMNHIFTGWYYDEAQTKLVDENNLDVTSDITLYAGWRLPLHKFVDAGNGIYIYTAKSAAVIGTVENPLSGNGSYVEYKQTVLFPKGVGSVGIAFRMDINVDYAYETIGTNYLSVQFAGSGLRVSRVTDGNWTRLVSDRAITTLPQTWQDKYNAAADGEELTAVLTIRDYGSYFETYIDGELAYTYAGTHDITTYTGNGYGIRSSNTATYKDMSAKVVTTN